MADLDDVYNTRILELAANIPRTGHLEAPQARASARSKLCGSEIEVEISMSGGKISDFAQTVKACLLGQAAAAVAGANAVGATPEEIRAVAAQMRAMLKENGPPPTGKWADLEVLQPVREYKHRHDAVMLVFQALDKAMAEVEARAAA